MACSTIPMITFLGVEFLYSCVAYIRIPVRRKQLTQKQEVVAVLYIISEIYSYKNLYKAIRVDNENNITIIGCCVSDMRKSAIITECWTPQSNRRDTLFSIYFVRTHKKMERLTTCFTFCRRLQKPFLIRHLYNYFEVGVGN